MQNFFSHGSYCLHHGLYFEIGALDGVTFSNTYGLEHDLSWSGFLVEAVPSSAKKLSKNRPNEKNFIYGNAVCNEFEKSVK